MPVKLLTLSEVAEILRVNRETVYRMARDGRIPATKVGHQWRFNRSSIGAWLKESEVLNTK